MSPRHRTRPALTTCVVDPALARRLIETCEGTHERCGLLFGVTRPEERRVLLVEELSNRSKTQDAFRLDPAEVVRCIRAVESQFGAAERETALECLGVWHTHPDCGPQLSERDRKGTPEDWTQLIVAAGGRIAAYHHGIDGEFRELRVRLAADQLPLA